jgi:hypothetical protein
MTLWRPREGQRNKRPREIISCLSTATCEESQVPQIEKYFRYCCRGLEMYKYSY